MKFVPVPITGGPTAGQRVLFCVWETRVQDYDVFANETERVLRKLDFKQGPTHPVVAITRDDAVAFCAWLTERERKAGKLGANETHRLPSDHEWSCAVGIGEREEAAKSPAEKQSKIAGVFPWGTSWPPPPGAGNYAGEEVHAATTAGSRSFGGGAIAGRSDPFAFTAPTGSFAANELGLFDLGGNVFEMCEDWFDATQSEHVVRGHRWYACTPDQCNSSCRSRATQTVQAAHLGFRVVLAPAR